MLSFWMKLFWTIRLPMKYPLFLFISFVHITIKISLTIIQVRKKADKYEHEEMESTTASHRSNNIVAGPTPDDILNYFTYFLFIYFRFYLFLISVYIIIPSMKAKSVQRILWRAGRTELFQGIFSYFFPYLKANLTLFIVKAQE